MSLVGNVMVARGAFMERSLEFSRCVEGGKDQDTLQSGFSVDKLLRW